MIDINKIPGFEKTPKFADCWERVNEIYTIAGLKSVIPKNQQLAKVLKKLLDYRRKLLEACIELLQAHERKCSFDHHGNCQEHGYFSDIPGDCGVKEAFDTVEEITGKTWEELQT